MRVGLQRRSLNFAFAFLIALVLGWAIQPGWAAHSHVLQQQNPQPQKRGAGHVEDIFGGGDESNNSSHTESTTRRRNTSTNQSSANQIQQTANPTRNANSNASKSARTMSARNTPRSFVHLTVPSPVRFDIERGRGLLVRAWINGTGPYTLAIDTGAGATILSQRVADAAHVEIKSGRATAISGLSGATPVNGREAFINQLALGERSNMLPAKGLVIVTDRLPPDVDGVLDPTESYWPLGYTLDMESGNLTAFDSHLTPLRLSNAPPDGTIERAQRDAATLQRINPARIKFNRQLIQLATQIPTLQNLRGR